ncbi:hypothetical protein BJY16_004477 [Actinoplanes octamycinicus]|uniref:Uncharacterized protein n=1 Tax=Actinoplanes octamycinicus TaxID=135948 RepID=A0A7W7M8K2_9ACTN|nr:hypothetical protein [Actinoplanes octamycinicus]MBB4741018.1 hypothetical protein [Actinoplanes octamycinicus]
MLLETGRPRWRDHLVPAAVILVGVLAVVAVGLGVRASRSAEPVHTQPVVAEVTDAPVAQVPIPLPSPSVSTTPVPVNSIVVEEGGVPDTVDLAAEGKIDWVHWGEAGPYAMERSARGGFAILEGTPDAPRERHTLSPQRFRWTGGTPAAGNSGTTSGVRTCGEGNGFRLSAPATTNPMRLRLYLGVSGATGLLKLKLSSGGKTVTTEMTQRGSSLETAKYTIDYQATKAGKISIEWITDESFAADCGGVALQAATLF